VEPSSGPVARLGEDGGVTEVGACPCGSGEPYAACCGPAHAGAPVPTAEALMRSRYSAFALGLGPYLLATWHPATRPADLDLETEVTWRRLQIVDTAAGGAGDAEGEVEFRASYRAPTGSGLLHERSRFVRADGRWTYLDGDVRGG
jgi:SEC-C motif domain protein